MKGMIVLDLDGTLLNTSQEISIRVKSYLKELASNFHIVIATGRHHLAAERYYRELDLLTPMICCNGAYKYDFKRNKILDSSSIKISEAIYLYHLLLNYKYSYALYTMHQILFEAASKPNYIDSLIKTSQTHFDDSFFIAESEDMYAQINQADHIWKFVIESEDISKLSADLFLMNSFECQQSWHNRYDFFVKGNSKGEQLMRMMKSFGYSPQRVIVVGDNHNDISMFEVADHSIAMLNADPIVREQATLVTQTDNNGEGIIDALEEILTRRMI